MFGRDRIKSVRYIATVDLETTGLDADARVIEAACTYIVEADPGRWTLEPVVAWFTSVNPECPIPPQASAVHHITDSMVRYAPTWNEVLPSLTHPLRAAHNVTFEKQFIASDSLWICSYRCARHLIAAPAYNLQTLRYHLGLKLPAWAGPPHRALADALLSAQILVMLLDRYPVEELIRLTGEPVLLQTITFGMHRGKPWTEVPTSYLSWLLNSNYANADEQFTARHHLRLRADENRGRAIAMAK